MHCLLLEEDIAWVEEGHIARCFGRQEQDCNMSRLLHPFFAPWPIGKIVDYYCLLYGAVVSDEILRRDDSRSILSLYWKTMERKITLAKLRSIIIFIWLP